MITSTQRRGAEVFAHQLVARLAARGRPGRLVALTAGEGDARLDVPILGQRPLSPATLRALRREAGEVALVVAHGSRTLPACSVALAGTGTPFIYRSIGDPTAWSASGLRRVRTAVTLRRAAAVTALWPGGADVMAARHGVPRSKLHVVPNGVDATTIVTADPTRRAAVRRQLGLPVDEPIVAVVGALSAEKQVEHAVRAVADLADVHLAIAGDGPRRDAVAALAATLLPGRAHLLGALADAAPLLAAVDVVACTSRTEGMPAVLIEAGMAARPVVAYDVGAVGEVVADGETGLLVAPGDTTAFGAALAVALADDGALGAAARTRCLARFELDVVAAAWDRLLADLLGEPDPGVGIRHLS